MSISTGMVRWFETKKVDRKCQHFFAVKKTTDYGLFSHNTSRTIVKSFTNRKKAMEYCSHMNQYSDSSFAVWNGKGDICKSDILYGVNTGPG